MSRDCNVSPCPSDGCAWSTASTIASSRSSVNSFQQTSTLVKADTSTSPRGILIHDLAVEQSGCTTIQASPSQVWNLSLPRSGTIPLAVHEEREEQGCPPPVSEVQIPLAAVVEQGLIELSKKDWKALYLSTHQNLEEANRYAYAVQEENRLLKRKLIEMQKCLFETRRNKRPWTEHQFPWTIPDYPRPNTPTPVTTSPTEDEYSTGKPPSKVLRQDSEASSAFS